MRACADIFVTKRGLMTQFRLSSEAAQGRIKRAVRAGSLLPLKKGLYLNANAYAYVYAYESERAGLAELIASKLNSDSYISLEYILRKYGVLPSQTSESSQISQPSQLPQSIPSQSLSITSVTTRQTPDFSNFAGNFVYKNIKSACYFGFEEVKFRDQVYRVATKAKALFDYLYLKSEFGSRNEKYLYRQLFHESQIQWKNFSEEDFKKFEQYVWISNSFKMMRLRRAIETYFENKKFDAWRKELLK